MSDATSFTTLQLPSQQEIKDGLLKLLYKPQQMIYARQFLIVGLQNSGNVRIMKFQEGFQCVICQM
jgi:hypothetical protein